MKTVMVMLGSGVCSAVIASASEAIHAACGGWIASSLRSSQRRSPDYSEREYPLDRRQCFGYHRTMKAGPDIAMVASLVGDPARANMLTALMTGRALTASELAQPGRHHAADREFASGEARGRRR